MAPSIAYTRASTAVSSSHPSVLRSLASPNAKCHRVTAVRTLWWWGKHGTWSCSGEENNEDRYQRHRKIMMHRYSRALRRRAMWDRDDHLASWTGRVPDNRLARKWGACRAMSSTDPTNARLNNKPDIFWDEFRHDNCKHRSDSEWEAFKSAIDRDIARDPYGTLFGRRVHSPSSENNSSWFAWLFDRCYLPQETSSAQPKSSTSKKIEIEVLDKKQNPSDPVKSNSPKTDAPLSSTAPSSMTEEYKYDPISGRKILQSFVKLDEPPKAPQSFLETLFSEHGAEPDKPVKQHQVHGYKSTSSKPTTILEQPKIEPSSESLRGFGSSRTHEYQQLRAATLGNNMDTTAEYGGKVEAEPSGGDETADQRTRIVPEPEVDAPLFSGTAYASKADQIVLGSCRTKPSWLEKEGFQDQEGAVVNNDRSKDRSCPPRLEPSFDRMQSTLENGKKFITKLQPAIDRVQLAKRTEPVKAEAAHQNVHPAELGSKKENANIINNFTQSEAERGEDIDLLRASDVRAATKTTRTTKQEAERAKAKTRNQLEDSFEQVHKQQSEEFTPEVKNIRADSSKLARSIESVHKHANQYPNGIVAKTMKSLGIIDGRLKDYEKPYSASKLDLTERLEFGSDVLNKLPSIYKQPVQSLNVMPAETQTVEDELKARTSLTEALRMSSRNTDETKKKENVQIEQLAKGIRQIYETEYGPIDLSPATASTSAAPGQKFHVMEKSPPAQRSGEFEAEQAKFMSEVGQLSKNVQSVKKQAAQLETDWKNNSVTPDEASASVSKLFAMAETHLSNAEFLHRQADQRKQIKQAHPLSTATVKPGVPHYPAIEHHTHVFEPRYIALLQQVKGIRIHLLEISASLHDLQRSRPARSSLQTNEVPVERQLSGKLEPAEFSKATNPTPPLSPYLVLVYNKTTGEVDQNAMDRLPWSPAEKVEKVNPIKIMGNLNYPAAFVTHFVELEKAGYELSSGGGDMLIFQRRAPSPTKTESSGSGSVTLAPRALRDTIAAEEASAQPEIIETIAQPKNSLPQQAATVLDDIPAEIPAPGPAPPTAPPANPTKKSSKTGTKVRRQEQVFSGTIPLRKQRASKSEHRNEKSSSSHSESHKQSAEPNGAFFPRATRTIKRGILGATAFGAAIYTIGVVTEGVGAQAQVEGDEAIGPRRKIVMPVGQRTGIYSTESSRSD